MDPAHRMAKMHGLRHLIKGMAKLVSSGKGDHAMPKDAVAGVVTAAPGPGPGADPDELHEDPAEEAGETPEEEAGEEAGEPDLHSQVKEYMTRGLHRNGPDEKGTRVARTLPGMPTDGSQGHRGKGSRAPKFTGRR